MKKVIRLTESDLGRIVKRVISEQYNTTTATTTRPMVNYATKPNCKPGDKGTLVQQKNILALSDPMKGVFCKISTSIPSTSGAGGAKPSTRPATPRTKPPTTNTGIMLPQGPVSTGSDDGLV